MAIQNLAQFVSDTIDSPVDHTNENLNETAIILTIIAIEPCAESDHCGQYGKGNAIQYLPVLLLNSVMLVL